MLVFIKEKESEMKDLSETVMEMIGEIPVEAENQELILNLIDIRKECMNAPREKQYVWRAVVQRELESKFIHSGLDIQDWQWKVTNIFCGVE